MRQDSSGKLRNMEISRKILFFTVVVILSFITECLSQNSRVVSTSIGKVAGELSPGLNTDGSTVFEFLGVPYAEAPVGENRFNAPVYPQPQEGLINQQKHARPCYQDGDDLERFLLNSRTSDESVRLPSISSEDCLYLNIYSPLGSSELFPVMVFIHGGNFNFGTGSAYKGTELARLNDVIVVTLNYRLGVFGFLYGGEQESEFSGNFGLLDQKMALKWVQENIQNFGGDANKVTLFGEEAGGASVHLHLLDQDEEAVNGSLFQQVIIQSAPFDDGLWTNEQSLEAYDEFISNLEETTGTSNISISDLRDEVFFSSAAIFQATSEKWHPTSPSGMQPSNAMMEGKFKKGINVIVGSNSAAGKYQITDLDGDDWLKNVTKEVIGTAFTQKYKLTEDEDVVDKMSQSYQQFYSWFGADDAAAIGRVRQSFSAILFGDQVYRTWSQSIAESLTSSCNCSVYEYLFNKNNGDQSVPKGSQLSEELKFLFGYENTDTRLTQRMMSLWSNFARTGNPNAETEVESVQHWDTYESEFALDCRNLVKIGNTGKITPHKNEVGTRTWQFWEAFYDTMEFSCSEKNSTIANDEDDLNEKDTCEETVGELLGLNDMSNETAAILMITFIATTGLFVLACCIIFGCFCHLKRKVKKSIKKMKTERKGQDNSGFAYKL